tara:strand:+ start:183 stop:473 length:291 start_codon:yes stop_codon:yes gene_type:complete
MSKWRLQTPKEIEAEIEQQKIKAAEEKVTAAFNKMLNKHAKRKGARMEKAPIKITEDGKLIIEYKGEQFDLMSEEAKDCHVKEGFNISRYKKKGGK